MNGNRNLQSQIHYLSGSSRVQVDERSLNISIGFCPAPNWKPVVVAIYLRLTPTYK